MNGTYTQCETDCYWLKNICANTSSLDFGEQHIILNWDACVQWV